MKGSTHYKHLINLFGKQNIYNFKRHFKLYIILKKKDKTCLSQKNYITISSNLKCLRKAEIKKNCLNSFLSFQNLKENYKDIIHFNAKYLLNFKGKARANEIIKFIKNIRNSKQT